MTTKREESDGETHAIGGAVYSLRPEYGRHVPCLECECGANFHGSTWEEAGAEYDAHLNSPAGAS